MITPYDMIPTVPVEEAEKYGLEYVLHENGEAILIPPKVDLAESAKSEKNSKKRGTTC